MLQESDDDEIVRKTTLREVKVLRSLKQDNIVNLKVCAATGQPLAPMLTGHTLGTHFFWEGGVYVGGARGGGGPGGFAREEECAWVGRQRGGGGDARGALETSWTCERGSSFTFLAPHAKTPRASLRLSASSPPLPASSPRLPARATPGHPPPPRVYIPAPPQPPLSASLLFPRSFPFSFHF